MHKLLHFIKTAAVSVAVFAPTVAGAQLVSLFTQYNEMQSFINPAAISGDFLQYQQNAVASLLYRRQWASIEDAPQTGLARFEYIMEGNSLSSFGGFLFKDKIGASNVQGFYGRYAYHLRPSTNADILFGLGISAGLLQYRIKPQELEFEVGDQLQGNSQTDWVPDFNLGASFTYFPQQGVKFYTGISVPQVARTRAKFDAEGNRKFALSRPGHLSLTAGAVIPVGQQGFLEPSIWVKGASGQPVNIDFNIRQKFVNNFWMGIGYGTARTLHVEAGAILTKWLNLQNGLLRIGGGYDYNIGGYGSQLGNTYEIVINYAFRASRKNK